MTMQTEILEAIREKPGITSTELIERLNVMDKAEVYQPLHQMDKDGLIKRDNARPKHCYPIDDALRVKAEHNTDLIATLSREVSELKEWRAQAIARFPELAISPKVLKASEMVARHFPDRRDAILRGSYDEKPIMKVCLDAMEME